MQGVAGGSGRQRKRATISRKTEIGRGLECPLTDLLFIAMLLTGFFSLMRLGEMAFPDDKKIQDWRKISRRRTIALSDNSYNSLSTKPTVSFLGTQLL